MEKEWANIIKLRSKQNHHFPNSQINSRTSESDEILSSDSDTNVEIKTSADQSYSEEAEKFFDLGLQSCEVNDKTPNFFEAAEYFRKSANLGHDRAQFNLGRMYEQGRGIKQSFTSAAEWYAKAALQGNPNAQCNLGGLFADGTGVNKDIEKAIDWYKKAALKGNIAAQFNLAKMYEKGQGVEKMKLLLLSITPTQLN
jgi:TPR repeat protein